mgnify:CR=1 FL=1
MCRALSGDVAAACRTRAPARAALESAHRVNEQILRLVDVRLLSGARWILEGVTLDVRRSELRRAHAGPSGSGEDHDPSDDCGARTVLSRDVIVAWTMLTLESGGGSAPASTLRRLRRKSGWCFNSTTCSSACSAEQHLPGAGAAYSMAPKGRGGRDVNSLRRSVWSIAPNALPQSCRVARPSESPSREHYAVDPPVLLMDEPTASLDPARRGELGDLLRQLSDGWIGRSLSPPMMRDFAR